MFFVFLAGMPSPSSHPSISLFCCSGFVPAVGTNLATTATQATAGGSSREASDRVQFGEAEECFFYYNTGHLRENTNTGGRRERGVKYGSFPAKTGDLTAMSNTRAVAESPTSRIQWTSGVSVCKVLGDPERYSGR